MQSLSFPQILTVFVCLAGLSNIANSHMPWLATDDQGRVVMWFGESTDDRTYAMPEKVAAIQLVADKSAVAMMPVESNSLVGIRSGQPVLTASEISGVVTYGLYHGTKLTYHVEHLPQSDSRTWPTEPRDGAALQSIIAASSSGGVHVTILHDGEPAKDVEVKLYCEEGHEEATAKTDIAGIVTFKRSAVEAGLNAIVVGITDGDAKGTLDGEAYNSTTDYLTATFKMLDVSNEKPESERQNKRPQPEENSGVSIVPSNLPELPEELTSFGAALSGNRIYVYGGHTGDAHSYSIDEQSNRFWCLDVSDGAGGSWASLPGGPSLQGLALVAHGQRIIRIGGFTATNSIGEKQDLRSQAGVASFDPTTQAWTELPPLPETRSSLDAVVLGDTVYVVGGWQLLGDSDASDWHDTAWSLDLNHSNATWQPIAKPNFQRRAISVAAHDGKLYVIGGMNSSGRPTTEVDVYDPVTNSWSAGPAIPGSGMSGFGSASFATGGCLYVSTMDGCVHKLGADKKAWTTVARSDPARFFHRMLPTSDTELLVIGGANMEIGKFRQIDRIELR